MPRRALILVVAACVWAAGSGGVSGAETRQGRVERQAEISQELRTLREQVAEASAQEALLLDRLDEVQARRRSLDARVAEVDRQVAVAEQEAGAAESRLEEVQADFVQAQTQLALASEALALQRSKLRARAVAAYIGNPSANVADLVLGSGSLRELEARIGYLEAVVRVQREAVRRRSALRDATEQLQASVEERKDVARRQRDVVVGRLGALEAVRAEKEAVRGAAAGEEAEHERLLAEVRRRRGEFEAEIAALRAESGTISALLRGVQAPRGAPAVTAAPGLLAPPLAGVAVTSRFGPRVHPILGTVRMHDGVDLPAPHGTPIRTAAAGTVVAAGPRGGYGETTIIDHGGALATLYAHQSAIFVIPGATVAAGQVIGAVGSTGFSTGPHLHFETRVNGVPVDPLGYL